MIKNKKIANTLIKRKNLVKLIKKIGVKRISPEAIITLEKSLTKNTLHIINVARQNSIIHGRKTIIKEDIKSAEETRNENSWEI